MKTLVKIAGIPTLPPHQRPAGDCVLRQLLEDEPQRLSQRWPPGFEGGVAHRLDISTSGAIAVADTPEELVSIRAHFSEKMLVKTYRFLSNKQVSWDENSCDLAIGHAKGKKGKMVVRRGANTPHRGKWYAAHTRFQRINGPLWQAQMSSGVMHQIRVHAAFLGLALRGDRRYGGGKTPEDAPDGLVFYLHHVGFKGPISTDSVPLPEWACP
ncbi:MAG: hypothetical protein GWP91_24935 [Rhodobacterales bacterium]|nr:hypothetical protein [Rhodobacterales bacterium]